MTSRQGAVRVPRKKIRRLVRLIDRHQQRLSEVDIAFLDEEEMDRNNRQFLSHAGPTDVISFDLSDADAVGLSVQLLICPAVARAQAVAHGETLTREILRYIAHGLLHQMGYDDQDPRNAARMHAREDELLDLLAREEKKQ
jgi:probable rRNA maturation factor